MIDPDGNLLFSCDSKTVRFHSPDGGTIYESAWEGLREISSRSIRFTNGKKIVIGSELEDSEVERLDSEWKKCDPVCWAKAQARLDRETRSLRSLLLFRMPVLALILGIAILVVIPLIERGLSEESVVIKTLHGVLGVSVLFAVLGPCCYLTFRNSFGAGSLDEAQAILRENNG